MKIVTIDAGVHRFEVELIDDGTYVDGGPVKIRYDSDLISLTRDQALRLAQELDWWLGR
jgi:hypothetical protein